MTDEEIQEWKERIDQMSQIECARIYRFAQSGHIFFNTMLPLHTYFDKHFRKVGGMTPEISKEIGWER